MCSSVSGIFRKATPERLFLLVYIPLVLAMMLVMPIGRPPDEQAHLRQAWLLSTGQIRTDTVTFPENLREILTDTDDFENDSLEIGTLWDVRISMETVTEQQNEATGIYPLAAYLPQALMMFLARLFTDRILILLYSTRVGSMLITSLLFYFAVRHSPAGKYILLAVACLPLTLQEAASASCDGMTIAGICWVLAEMLRRIYNINLDRPIRSLGICAGMGICVVLCKLLYAPVLLLGIMPFVPAGLGKTRKRRGNLMLVSSFLVALLIWYFFSVRPLAGQQGKTADALIRLNKLSANPLSLFEMQIRTLISCSPGWIRQLFGVFGRLNIFTPVSIAVPLAFFFLGIALTDSGTEALSLDKKQSCLIRFLLILIVFMSWMLLSGSLLIWWTKEGSPLIEGIQGRYFLPCLFCLLICLPTIRMEQPEDKQRFTSAALRNILLVLYLGFSAATIIWLGTHL